MKCYSIKQCVIIACALICSASLSFAFLNAKECWEAKVRGAAFIPTSSLFREIYGSAVGNFDAEMAVTIFKHLQIWANFDYASAHGHSLGFCDPTSINILNGSFGIKTPFDINDCVCVYLGFGPTVGSIKITDRSEFSGFSNSSETAAGFVVKFGFDFFFAERWFVDLFSDYVYQQTTFQKQVNASGLRIGAGIGCTF